MKNTFSQGTEKAGGVELVAGNSERD